MITGKVKLRIKGLSRFAAVLSSGDNKHLRDAYTKWAVRYRSFVQEEFVKNSRGGGLWPALKPATIARRRKNSAVILRDTNTLFAALNPVFSGTPGQFQQPLKHGIEVGFGGPSGHPDAPLTVAQLAAVHNTGARIKGGRIPKRKIIHQLTADLKSKMGVDMDLALHRIAMDELKEHVGG